MIQNVSVVYNFSTSGGSHPWSGTYSLNNNPSLTMVQNALNGNVCSPGDILKIDSGYSSTSGGVSGMIKNENYTLDSVKKSDWTQQIKEKWFENFLSSCGVNPSNFINLLSDFENTEFGGKKPFEILSAPSIAYLDYNNTEVVVGLNSYVNPFNSWCLTNGINGAQNVILSNAIHINWAGISHITWSFSGIQYPDFQFSSGGNIKDGGGNIFTEIRLAGDGISSHYQMKKEVNPNDPTKGFCSGTNGKFCYGDVIQVFDDSVRTEIIYSDVISGTASTSGMNGTNGTNGEIKDFFLFESVKTDWTWWGRDFYDNTWYIADITSPCDDYSNIPISQRLFPIMVWETWDSSGHSSC